MWLSLLQASCVNFLTLRLSHSREPGFFWRDGISHDEKNEIFQREKYCRVVGKYCAYIDISNGGWYGWSYEATGCSGNYGFRNGVALWM